MSTPTWAAASTGVQAVAAQVNQFLGTHSSLFLYQGVNQVSNGIGSAANEYISGSVTKAINTNTGAAAQWVDQPFTTAASQTSIDRVVIAPFPAATAFDTTVSLQADSSGNPSGPSLASVTLPADFIAFAPYTSSSNTTYTSTSVTDTGATFPLYGYHTGAVALIFGWLLVAGSSFGVVTATGTTNTAAVTVTQWFNYSTGSSSTPTANTVYKAYPALSVPLNATGLTASTKYHIVIGGTTNTTNYDQLAATASVAGEVTQTGTSSTGPWTATTQTLIFGVFAKTPGNPPGTALRHTWEDAGARWVGYDYVITNAVKAAPQLLIAREYTTGTLRSARLASYPTNAGVASASGLLQSI